MNKLFSFFNSLQVFYKSILLGFFIWLLIYLFLPASNVEPFLLESIFYVIGSIILFVLGYGIVPLKRKHTLLVLDKNILIGFIIFFVAIFSIRYYDVFYLRGVSISYSTKENRLLLEQGLKYNNIFLTLITILKAAYFLPLIIYFKVNKKHVLLYVLCLLLFALPFPEALVRGSRNQIFEAVALLVVIHLFFNKIRFNVYTIIKAFVILLLMVFVSSSILHKRESVKKINYEKLVSKDVIYNQLLQPKPWVYEKVKNIDNKNLSKTVISGVQIGQYYCHSVFEMNHLFHHFNNDFQYGKYNFMMVCKFLNHYGIKKFDLKKITNAAPRKITYLTLFGDLYIDFGWISLILLFVLGMLQKVIYNHLNNGFLGVILTAILYL